VQCGSCLPYASELIDEERSARFTPAEQAA
jgi:bacterioferritin-associated ferredoxin